MPQFAPKRFEEIFAQMIARLVARTDLSDVVDTSVFKHILAAAARADDEQYFQMGLLLKLFSIDTATGTDLDERAKDIQPGTLTRLTASKATGLVVFSRNGTVGTTTIPIGTKVKTASGVIFVTTTLGTITAVSGEQIYGHGVGRDSNTVAVIAVVGAAAGNVAANTVIKFDSKPTGVDEVTNPSAFANGFDRETDDAFRQRLKNFIAGLARCTVGAIEANVLGQYDSVSNATILFAHVWEDIVSRGNAILYVDDGTGSAEAISSSPTALDEATETYTWNGTTTVTSGDTSRVAVDDWIQYGSTGKLFQISVVTPSTSVTILNPGADAIPTGSALDTYKVEDIVTVGLDVGDVAFGGETTLYLDNKPIKSALPVVLASDLRGDLVLDTDFFLNPATGQVDFDPALTTGEQIASSYVYYTGLVAFAQKIVDGDPTDQDNYPGLRAAGVLIRALPPSVFLQVVSAVVTVEEGYTQANVHAAVVQAIKDYINTLAISGDVIRNKLIEFIMGVDGVSDVSLTAPATNITILDDQLARTTDGNITVT